MDHLPTTVAVIGLGASFQLNSLLHSVRRGVVRRRSQRAGSSHTITRATGCSYKTTPRPVTASYGHSKTNVYLPILGAFGLVTVKNLTEEGFKVTAFESKPYIGGLWRCAEGSQTSVLPCELLTYQVAPRLVACELTPAQLLLPMSRNTG